MPGSDRISFPEQRVSRTPTAADPQACPTMTVRSRSSACAITSPPEESGLKEIVVLLQT